MLAEKVGVFRNETQLKEAVEEIRELRGQYRAVRVRTPPGPFQSEVVHAMELEGLLSLSEITARGALERRESRGSHFRTDFPERNDAKWLRHTAAHREGDELRLDYKDVDASLHPPQARTY